MDNENEIFIQNQITEIATTNHLSCWQEKKYIKKAKRTRLAFLIGIILLRGQRGIHGGRNISVAFHKS